MEVTKTIPEATVPLSVENHKIILVGIDPVTKEGVVRTDQYAKIEVYRVDLTSVWTLLTATQKTTIKTFFKKVVELALGVEPTDITGEVIK